MGGWYHVGPRVGRNRGKVLKEKSRWWCVRALLYDRFLYLSWQHAQFQVNEYE